MAVQRAGMRIVKDGLPDLVKAIKRLTSREVLVGISQATDAREAAPGEKGEPLGNSQIAFIQEFGSPAANIPARPFLVPGIESAKEKISSKLKAVGKAALSGKIDQIEPGFENVGLIAQMAVQKKIVDGPFEPLKPGTLAARRRRGVIRTHPLIDTGVLRQAITYAVRDK